MNSTARVAQLRADCFTGVMIINGHQRSALVFVSAANQGGFRPTSDQVTEWVLRPNPLPPKKGKLLKAAKPSPAIAGIASLAQQISLSSFATPEYLKGTEAVYEPSGPPESLVASLLRLSWLELDDRGGLSLSPLGKALLRADRLTSQDDEGISVVVLEAESQLSYVQLMGHIVDSGPAFVIDPYVRSDELWQLMAYTDARRVLVGPLNVKDTTGLRLLLGAVSGTVEVRQAGKGILHDRYIIGNKGVHHFGASINGVGKNATTTLVLMPEYAADRIRELAEQWWNDSSVLEPVTGPPKEDSIDGPAADTCVERPV